MARLRALLLHSRTPFKKPPSRSDVVVALMDGEYIPVAADKREVRKGHAPADADIHDFLSHVVQQSTTILVNWWSNTQLAVFEDRRPIPVIRYDPDPPLRSTAPGDMVLVSIDDDLVLLYAVTAHGFQPL